MKTRIISGLLLLVVAIIIIGIGGVPMYLTGTALAIIALKEFYSAVSNKLSIQNYFSMVFTVLMFISVYLRNTDIAVIFSMLYMLSNFLYLLKEHDKIKLVDFFANVFGVIYIVPAFLIMCIIRDHIFGVYLLGLVFVSSTITDTFAYFVGKAIGKNKLAPKLSPNKTIEGSVGGSLASTVVFVICAITILQNKFLFTLEMNDIGILFLIGLASSILSQIGDLSASAIKRITGIKDYGNLIPGHGGVLDRIDSTLFTAPVMYVVLYTLIY